MNDYTTQRHYGQASQSDITVTVSELEDALNFAITDMWRCLRYHRAGMYSCLEMCSQVFLALYHKTYLATKAYMKTADFEELSEFVIDPLSSIIWINSDMESPEMRPQFETLGKEMHKKYFLYKEALYKAGFGTVTKPTLM